MDVGGRQVGARAHPGDRLVQAVDDHGLHPGQAAGRFRMMNPRQNIRCHGDLGVVEGVFGNRPAAGKIDQTENDPRGAQVDRQARHHLWGFWIGHGKEDMPLPVFEQKAPRRIIPPPEGFGNPFDEIEIDPDPVCAKPLGEGPLQAVDVGGIVFQAGGRQAHGDDPAALSRPCRERFCCRTGHNVSVSSSAIRAFITMPAPPLIR